MAAITTAFAAPSVSGSVYNDLNNNGTRDIGESGIENVEVRAISTSTPPTITQTLTGPDGSYALLINTTEFWNILQTQPSDWADGKESIAVPFGLVAEDSYTDISLTGSTVADGFNFGEIGPRDYPVRHAVQIEDHRVVASDGEGIDLYGTSIAIDGEMPCAMTSCQLLLR